MSFLYPRTVSISRPHANPTTDVGDQGYNAERGAADETVLATDLPASIQLDRQGQKNGEGLPTDARYQAIYKVFIPKSAAAPGSIKSADVVTDDQGVRYQVFSPYWDSLGYRLGGIVLEV